MPEQSKITDALFVHLHHLGMKWWRDESPLGTTLRLRGANGRPCRGFSGLVLWSRDEPSNVQARVYRWGEGDVCEDDAEQIDTIFMVCDGASAEEVARAAMLDVEDSVSRIIQDIEGQEEEPTNA